MADKRIADLFDQHIYFEEPDHPDDVIVEGSDSELSERARRRKHEEIKHAAKEYILYRRAPFIASAQLRGTFTKAEGSTNPWRKESKVQKPQREKTKIHRRSQLFSNKAPETEEDLDITSLGAQRPGRQISQETQSRGDPRRPITAFKPLKPEREIVKAYPHQSRASLFSKNASKPEEDYDLPSHNASMRPARYPSKNSSVPVTQAAQSHELPRVATRATTKHAPRREMPTPSQSSYPSTAVQIGTEETWLKKKLFSKKSVWETPYGDTPTPAKVAAVASKERKRRAPIVRMSSSRSSQSGAAEPSTQRTASHISWQHAQPSHISSYDNSYNSTGLDSRRQSFGSSTKVRPSGMPSTSGRQLPGIKRTASTRKKVSEDRQISPFESILDAHSITEDSSQKPRDRSQAWDNDPPVSSDTEFARSTINNDLASKNCGGGVIQSVERDVDSALEYSGLGSTRREASTNQEFQRFLGDEYDYPAAQPQSPLETPLSAQVGSFSKYQLSLPKFDFDNLQSQKSAEDGFAFSFNGGMSSQARQPNTRSASRSISVNSQSSFGKSIFGKFAKTPGRAKSYSANKVPPAQTAPAPKLIDHSFQFTKAEKAAQKDKSDDVAQAVQVRGHNQVAEDIGRDGSESQNISLPGTARIRRPLPFEEDDSPGFMGPRRKRHKENTKMKELQTQGYPEPAAANPATIGSASKAAKLDPVIQTEDEPVLEVSATEDINSERAAEIPRVTLSTFVSVNATEDPSISENVVKTGQATHIVNNTPSRASPKFVVSAIMAVEITPRKQTSPPGQVDNIESVTNPAGTPTRSPTPSSRVPVPELESPSAVANASPISKSKSPPSISLQEPVPRKSSESDKDLSDEELTSRSTKSPSVDEPPPTPKVADEVPVEDQEVSQKSTAHNIIEPVVDCDTFAPEEPLDLGSPNLTSPGINPSQIPSAKIDGDFSSKSPSQPRNSANLLSQSPRRSPVQNLSQSSFTKRTSSQHVTRKETPFTKFAKRTSSTGLKGVSPEQNAPDHQSIQSSWSFNDTTLSDPSAIDSSALLAVTPRAKTPIGRSALSRVESNSVPGENEVSSLDIEEHSPSSVQAKAVREEKEGPPLNTEESSPLSVQVKTVEKEKEVVPLETEGVSPSSVVAIAVEEVKERPALDTENLSTSSAKSKAVEQDIIVSSGIQSRDFSGKGPIQPTKAVEDVEISSDDEEEDIPNSRPAQISSLRNSFLSPKRKKKRPKRSTGKSPHKLLFSGPQTPERLSAKVNEQPRSITTKNPIQAMNEDPMTEEEARLDAEFEAAEPQSPWNTADAEPLPPIFPPTTLKTPLANIEDPIAQSRSTSSRVASDLQTGWDDSGFEYIPRHELESDPPQENPSQHSIPEPFETTTTPTKWGTRPFNTFMTPSPPKQRVAQVGFSKGFPHTQALRDAALKNPWASSSTIKKTASNKRVSFAPDNESGETTSATQRPEKRQRFLSPPPPSSDDSLGIDGSEDKLAMRLRAAKTRKLPPQISNKPSSSPPADAVALAFIAADKQALPITKPGSRGKRNSQAFENDDNGGNGTSSRPAKRQYRPSQSSLNDDYSESDDNADAASSFEISPDGEVTPVKNRRSAMSSSKKSRSGSGSSGNLSTRHEHREDIAALVESDIDQVIDDVFLEGFEGWNVDEEVRRASGGVARSAKGKRRALLRR